MRLRPRQQRRGNVMVLFAALSFAFMALAALAIDTGFALLAQKQMNSANDTAALEAMRFRDEIPQDLIDHIQSDPDVGPPPASTQTPTDPDWITWRNKARRALARMQMGDLYELGLTPAQQQHYYGTGPVADLSGGITVSGSSGTGSFQASQTLSPGISYNPATKLKLNPDDTDSAGDMLAGTYTDPVDPITGQPELHTESAGYVRNDFASSGSAPNAFLVRLRRTNENFNDDTKSSGPPVPYLFGKATLLNAQAKARGISVRSTSIAEGKPVLSVGVADTSNQVRGAAPVAVALSWWNDPANGVNATLPLDGSSSDVRGFDPTTAVVGQPAPASALPTLDANDVPYFIYVPLYSNVSGERIVGFGHAKITAGTTPTLTKLAGMIAPENATPVLTLPLPTGVNFTALRQAQDTIDEPLKTPALVR